MTRRDNDVNQKAEPIKVDYTFFPSRRPRLLLFLFVRRGAGPLTRPWRVSQWERASRPPLALHGIVDSRMRSRQRAMARAWAKPRAGMR
jgi:hypothetical protein